MTLPPVILLVALCFGAGWGLDVWLGSSGENDAAMPSRIPAMSTAKPGAQPAAMTGTASSESSAAPSARTLEQLLHLVTGVPYATGRARAEIAIGQLTAAELGAAGEALRLRLQTKPRERLPAQVTDPLLLRWLAVDPQAALRVCVGPWYLIKGEIKKSVMEALTNEAREHPQYIATMATHLYLPEGCWEACVEAVNVLPPQEALPRLLAMGARRGGSRTFSWGDLPELWIARDPRAAMTWAISLPPGKVRHHLLDTMATMWGKAHSGEAIAFIQALPPASASPGLRAYLEDLASEEFIPGIPLR